MREAEIKETGEIIDVDDFVINYGTRYKRRNITPVCPCCDSPLHLYGQHSDNVDTIFHHHDNHPPCLIASETNEKTGWRPKNWDFKNRHKVRAAFLNDDEALRDAYAMCWKMLNLRGVLPAEKFASLIKKADQKGIWAYKGMRPWAVPFLLMTLDDFDYRTSGGKHFSFRFMIKGKRARLGNEADAIWSRGGRSAVLHKIGMPSGEIHSHRRTKGVRAWNKFEISSEEATHLAGDSSWVNDGVLKHIRKVAEKPAKPRLERGKTPQWGEAKELPKDKKSGNKKKPKKKPVPKTKIPTPSKVDLDGF